MADASTWPVLIGAAIGAGGAVIAQVTSAVFTARRETARLKWEKHRQERDWKLRESERFLSLKQELYSRYIALTGRIAMDVLLLTEKEYTNEPDWQQRVPEYTGPVYDEIEHIRSNIRLVGSPVTFERAEVCNACLLVATGEAMRPDRSSLEKRHKLAGRALRALQELSDAMRADLRGDEETLRRM